MYIHIDDNGRIDAFNINDMSGNSGWVSVEEPIAEPLHNTDGVALYKYTDGHVGIRTEADIAADTPTPSDEISDSEVLNILLGVES